MSLNVLSQKTVLVTGASGGLGEEVCRAFQAAGAVVAGTARHAEQLKNCDIALAADLTTPEGAAACVAALRSQTPKLDGVVHLMGGFAAVGTVQETTSGTWDRMMSLNVDSAFYLFREALPQLVKQGSGRIIAVGSRAGVALPGGLSAYAVSKAALHALVQVVAAENKHTGVTANVVMPSVIDTAVNRAAMPDADQTLWVPPASIAELLIWLASDASQHVNGALIPIYGRA